MTCPRCAAETEPAHACAPCIATGDPGTCRSCGASITWLKHANGKRAPYDSDGVNHFATCPNANQHRKKP